MMLYRYVASTLLLAIPLLSAAADGATSLSDARSAVEVNLRTPEGKAFDEQFGRDFVQKHLAALRQCKQSAGGDLRSFWILANLEKDGTAKEVLFYPERNWPRAHEPR
jgi:hypothetical protein